MAVSKTERIEFFTEFHNFSGEISEIVHRVLNEDPTITKYESFSRPRFETSYDERYEAEIFHIIFESSKIKFHVESYSPEVALDLAQRELDRLRIEYPEKQLASV